MNKNARVILILAFFVICADHVGFGRIEKIGIRLLLISILPVCIFELSTQYINLSSDLSRSITLLVMKEVQSNQTKESNHMLVGQQQR